MRRNASELAAVAQLELDKIYLQQLPVISLVIAGYYAFITVSHGLILPPDQVWPIMGTSALATITALGLYLLLRYKKIPASKSHLAFVPVGIAIPLTVFTHVYMSGDQLQLLNVILVIYGFGFVTLLPRLYAVLIIACCAGYLHALIFLPGPYAVHFFFALIASVALGIMGFTLRYRALVRSVRLLIISRRKTQRLTVATEEIRCRMLEVQRANEVRDIFLANVTHELRTPLTGVIGMLDLIYDSELDKDQSYLISTAQKSAGYLLHIVNDLLDLSKLDAGKLELKKSPVDLVALSQGALETFRATAASKSITLEYVGPPQAEIWGVADGARLSQVLLNLISNAVKFTEKGGVVLEFVWQEESASQTDAVATWHIKDTGYGIPKEKISHMFDRFSQLDTAKTRTSVGTGLGLSIVHELVMLMDGAVTVESDVGMGATFTVTMKLKQSKQGDVGVLSKERSTLKMEEIQALQMKALVAEDNPINQMLISRLLGRFGIDVTVVGNGQLALDAVHAADPQFDLVFMDAQMPVMDGITSARLMKEQVPACPPIIAITANTSENDQQEYKAAGMDTLVGKPINIEQCQSAILDVIMAGRGIAKKQKPV